MPAAKETRRRDIYLIAVLAMAAAFTIFWTLYAAYAYNTFQDQYFDMGELPYSLYMHLCCTSMTAGLQYFVFGNHLSPFAILLLPLSAAWPSPLSTVAVQDLFMAMAAVMAYLICRDMLQFRQLGLVMTLLFLVSPAIIGPASFDVHLEGFMPFFYLLAFYLYMRGSGKWFLASYALLASIMESAPYVGATLIAGLAFYEYVHYRRSREFDKATHRKRLALLAAAAAITLVFVAFYTLVTAALVHDYATGLYASLPPYARVIDFMGAQATAILNPASSAIAQNPSGFILFPILGLLILFLGFGITALADPLLTSILIGAWLFEVFYLRNFAFATPIYQYYLYAISGSLVGSVLGAKILMARKDALGALFRSRSFVPAAALSFGLVVSAFVLFLFTFLHMPVALSTFVSAAAPNAPNYASIEAALASIPSNASLMVQPDVFPHTIYHNIETELPPDLTQIDLPSNTLSFYWFRPQYIAVYRNDSTDDTMFTASFNVYAYMGDNYTTYYNSSAFAIYRLK